MSIAKCPRGSQTLAKASGSKSADLVDERGLSDRVSFPGWLPEADAYRYLASADLGVDASLQEEVSPVKAVEYMAFGLPFVAFDLEETRVSAADAAVYATPNDPSGLAALVMELLDDPDRRARMGDIGRERVSGPLSWANSARNLLSAYEAAADRARRP